MSGRDATRREGAIPSDVKDAPDLATVTGVRFLATDPEPQPQEKAAPPPDLTGTVLGHFRIAGVLGRGGMGVVYRAVDEVLRRPVALKVLPPELAARRQPRAPETEARAAAAVTHANVARVYEVGEDRRAVSTSRWSWSRARRCAAGWRGGCGSTERAPRRRADRAGSRARPREGGRSTAT